MPASKKDLRAQKQKANIKAGIGDEKGRLPSQTKVVRYYGYYDGARFHAFQCCYCIWTASELPWCITLPRMPLWWQAALCASSRSGWSRKMNRFFLNWEEGMRGGRGSKLFKQQRGKDSARLNWARTLLPAPRKSIEFSRDESERGRFEEGKWWGSSGLIHLLGQSSCWQQAR